MSTRDLNQIPIDAVAAQLGRVLNGSLCQPCLVCNSSDAMQVNDDNTIHCYSCGFHGGPLKIIASHYGLKINTQFGEVAQKLRNMFNIQDNFMKNINNSHIAENIWNESKSVSAESPCLRYFQNRNITLSEIPCSLRYFEKERALILPFYNENQQITGIHRTFLTDSFCNVKEEGRKGEERSKKRALGRCRGLITAYRCLEDRQSLIIAEGLEKTVALRSLIGPANYSIAYSTSVLKSQDTVKQIREDGFRHVLICADNDLMCQGIEAASVLFFNLKKCNISAQILKPKMVGKDWDDLLNGGAA